MNQRKAFKETLELAWERGMHFVEGLHPDLTYRHLVSMHDRMTLDETMSETKIGRWLGWAQAAVVASGVATLDEMKALNQRYSAEAWKVTQLHQDCARCEDCAEAAITHAKVTGSVGSSWREMLPDAHGKAYVGHEATVERSN
ncbi:hypothetical protein IXEL_57 [Microbacterium phage Ixel]|nr:hypothetical protein IXEL_57 [Microbacterium phage Ixel]